MALALMVIQFGFKGQHLEQYLVQISKHSISQVLVSSVCIFDLL
jgi:hypothetical protein